MSNKYSFLPIGSSSYYGIISNLIDYVNKEQLLDSKLWAKFVKVFIDHPDSDDLFWRCEFWGKMMRGACLCYHYENDDKLYNVLEITVKDLLSTQDKLGRFSSYEVDKEFQAWDMWGRKYVTTSLLHFYSICKDKKLKDRIIKALEKHIDYIIKHIGKEKGKISITKTSNFWLGVNSCSILESIVSLYEVSKEKRFLDFAKYIISTGGIEGGDLIESANDDNLLPYQYKEAKAYETMSFFEGVLEYALVTKNNKFYKTAINFFEKVEESEISIIGNAGSEDENFSHCSINQIKKPERFMQETCVVTTYMRIMAKLNLLTGDVKYYERFSRAALNCFLGSVNDNHNIAIDYWGKKVLKDYLPFDSYSPLYNDSRGKGTGGIQYFKEGGIYGCCACISSASVGLMALTFVINNDKEIVFNDYYDNGVINTKDFKAEIISDYIENGKVTINIKKNNKNLLFRIPSWSDNPIINIDGKISKVNPSMYYKVDKTAKKIVLEFHPTIKEHKIKNMIAFTYGPFTLGIDEESNPSLVLENLRAANIKLRKVKPTNKALLTFKTKDNLKFKDYSSLGRHYHIKRNRLTVWIKK